MADLIPGMTEIMDHIKKLEKENKELKAEVSVYKDETDDYVSELFDILNVEDIDDITPAVKKLKEANKMLNSYNEANIKLRQEKEDEIQELQIEYDQLKEDVDEYKNEKKHNESEIQELEEKITCLESDSHNEVSMAEYEDLQEDYKALEAKLEKLNKESGMDIIADCVELDTDNYTVEDIVKVIDDMETNMVKKNVEKLSLEKQLNQQQKWFEEINQLLEAEAEDPSVVVVEEYVKKMKIVDNELSKARKYERFLEYRLDQESIDYLIPDDYEERNFEGSSSEEEDN